MQQAVDRDVSGRKSSALALLKRRSFLVVPDLQDAEGTSIADRSRRGLVLVQSGELGVDGDAEPTIAAHITSSGFYEFHVWTCSP